MTELPEKNSAPTSRRSLGVLIWMIVSQVISLLLLVPWLDIDVLLLFAFKSSYSFQDGGLFVGAVLGYPVLLVCTAVLAWRLYTVKKERAALVVTSLLLAAALLGLVIFLFFYAGSPWLK